MQFNLLATGDLADPAQGKQLEKLSRKGRRLQNELAKTLAVEVSSPEKTLAGIAEKAEAQGEPATGQLRTALAVLESMNSELPKDACPTLPALQDAARHALKLPKP
jgi:spore germination cell wall hydrolase CwlJ-like protein